MPTTRSSSCTRCQNGSNSGSANDLRPFHVGTGATRHEEDLGAALVDVLELLDGAVDAGGEADDRRGVERVGVVVGPVLVHPLVQRVDHRHRDVGVVGHALLEDAGERRPQQRAVDAHLLHELHARLGVEERVDAGHHDQLLLVQPATRCRRSRRRPG